MKRKGVVTTTALLFTMLVLPFPRGGSNDSAAMPSETSGVQILSPELSLIEQEDLQLLHRIRLLGDYLEPDALGRARTNLYHSLPLEERREMVRKEVRALAARRYHKTPEQLSEAELHAAAGELAQHASKFAIAEMGSHDSAGGVLRFTVHPALSFVWEMYSEAVVAETRERRFRS